MQRNVITQESRMRLMHGTSTVSYTRPLYHPYKADAG